MARFLKEALVTKLRQSFTRFDEDEFRILKSLIQKNFNKFDSDTKIVNDIICGKLTNQLTDSLLLRITNAIIFLLPINFNYSDLVQLKIVEILLKSPYSLENSTTSKLIISKHFKIENLIILSDKSSLIKEHLKESKDPSAIAYFKLNQL